MGRIVAILIHCLILTSFATAKPMISERLLPKGKSGGAAHAASMLHFLVVFAPEVSPSDAERMLLDAGLVRVEHADLLPGQYLVSGSTEGLLRLADMEGPQFVLPASVALVEGHPVMGCAGPLTEGAVVAPFTSLIGQGWDGSGRRTANLTYSLERGSDRLPDSVVIGAIERALAEWASYADIQFSRTSNTAARENINVLFATGSHGDPYPFDGRSRVLAHAFYPAGVNPEPIAGDLHLDDDESWTDGGVTDVFSVVLHEIGHSLGVGHSDNPEAVMYPYYRSFTALHSEDIAAIRMLYSAVEKPSEPEPSPAPSAPSAPGPSPAPKAPSAPPSPAEPLKIETATDRIISEEVVGVSGTVTGGTGAVRVTYSLGGSAGVASGGRSWNISRLPVQSGVNQLRIDAEDEAGRKASATVKITRMNVSTSAEPDTARPVVKITFPALTTYLTSKDTLTITGTVTDKGSVSSVSCSRSGVVVTAAGTTRWSCDVPLLVGDNRVSVVAMDAAGNESTARQVLVTRR